MKESHLQRQFIDYLVMAGFMVLRINGGAAVVPATRTRRKRFIQFAYWLCLGHKKSGKGIADLIAFKNGRSIAIEAKRPGKLADTSDDQDTFLQVFANHGGLAFVVDDLEDLIAIVEDFNNGKL